MTETLANWYSSESTQRELYNEYQHDRVWMVFNFFGVLVLWRKVGSALEWLRMSSHHIKRVRLWITAVRLGRAASRNTIEGISSSSCRLR